MSKKSHRKQVARARAKRQQDRFQRRSARNRMIIIVMAVLMGLSLIAVPLTQLLASRGDAAVPEAPPTAPLTYDAPFEMTIDPDATYTATLATDAGDITVRLHAADAPETTNNLVNLARDGFYDGVIFHRVIEGFMIQGGDPTGTGGGDPGYRFADELELAEQVVEAEGGYPRGTLAMANAGPDTQGSQFFIMHQDYPLPAAYTVFGEVIDGLDVVDAIATAPTDEHDRPLEPVVIRTITIDEG